MIWPPFLNTMALIGKRKKVGTKKTQIYIYKPKGQESQANPKHGEWRTIKQNWENTGLYVICWI